MSTRPYTAGIEQVFLRYLRGLVLSGALLCICGILPAEGKERKELTTQLKMDFFKRYPAEILKQDISDALTSNQSENRVIRLGNWMHAPLEVGGATTDGSIRIRFEDDYLIIWHHSTSPRVKGDLLQLVREATEAVLAPRYAVGEPSMVVDTKAGYTRTDAEIVMFDWPKEISGTGGVSCGYYNGTRQWKYVAVVRVLVKNQDTVIALEKSKARTAVDKHTYEGLNAGKIRLTKEEAETVRSRPVLARNTIFPEDVDLTKVPDALLNACMWPIEDKTAVGAEDVGPASQLRPQSANREDDQG